MRPPICLYLASTALLFAPSAFAEEAKPLDEARLLSRVRAACLRPVTFDPDAMRRPLRLDPQADLKAARAVVSEKPSDFDAHWRLAEAAEAVGASDAVSEWQIVAAMVETKLRGKTPTPDLPEKQVIALIGANAGTRAVPAADRLRNALPQSWKASLLCGDAYFRRADLNWRVALRLVNAGKAAAQPLAQFKDDLVSARKAYDRASELAPAELGPRAGRIALELTRPLLLGLLPKDAVSGVDPSDLALVRDDLLQAAERGGVPGLWHSAVYFAERPSELAALKPERRAGLDRLLAAPAAEADKVYAAEARGMWRLALGKQSEARKDFEAAEAGPKERRVATSWLAWLDTRSGAGRAETVARLRESIKTAPSWESHATLASLLAEENLTDALVSAREAVRLGVQSESARYVLALLLMRKDIGAEEARYHLGELKAMAPDDAEATFLMLVVSAMDGGREAARLALQDLATAPNVDEDLRGRIRETVTDLAAK